MREEAAEGHARSAGDISAAATRATGRRGGGGGGSSSSDASGAVTGSSGGGGGGGGGGAAMGAAAAGGGGGEPASEPASCREKQIRVIVPPSYLTFDSWSYPYGCPLVYKNDTFIRIIG